MPLILTEDQEMLRETAAGFLEENAPVAAFRTMRDDDTPQGCSPDLWLDMARMGWAGILVPEEHGGSGFGIVGAGIIAGEMGKHLTASPYLATAIMAATALNHLGTAEQKSTHFPGITDGSSLFALAVDEGRKHAPAKIALKAERSGNGFKLNGRKTFVFDGHIADHVIVAARTSGEAGNRDGITLFLVDAKTAGLKCERTRMVDSRNAAEITFNEVQIDADAVLGDIDHGMAGLETILNAGRAGLAAEMTGSALQAFAMSMAYINERKQFGVPVGSFQALQHRAAHLYTEIEMSKAIVLSALHALDDGDELAAQKVALAKTKAGQVALLAAQEGVQLHGGMGMTDEFDVGLYLKRVKVAGEMLGDSSFHGEAFARQLGF